MLLDGGQARVYLLCVDQFGKRGIAKLVFMPGRKGNKDLREIIKGG